MAYLDFLFGKNEKLQQYPKYTPGQENVFNQLLSGSQQQIPDIFKYLQGILGQNPESMQAFEAPAMRQFQEKILPSIAERFSGLDAQNSSAFAQTLGQAGAGLAENLSAQRANLSSGALKQLLQLLGTGLSPQFENVLRPSQGGFLQKLLGGIL
jgi:hypothetical protein